MFALLVVLRGYSNSFNLFNVAKLSWNRIGRSGVQAEIENATFAFHELTFSTKPRIWSFYVIRDLKHRRRGRQRERQKTIVLISKILALHVHYTLWYISLPSSAKQRREMTKFKVLWRT